MTGLLYKICVGVLVSVVMGRMIINEYDLLGDEGLQGHSWTLTEDSDNPQMIMQVSEMHADGSVSDNFYKPSEMMKQAMVEFAWISQQFDMLADLEQRMMSSCAHHMMINDMYNRANPSTVGFTQTTPASTQDTDALYKYMSYNRFSPLAVAVIEPYRFYDDAQFQETQPKEIELGFVEVDYPFQASMLDSDKGYDKFYYPDQDLDFFEDGNGMYTVWDGNFYNFYDTEYDYDYDYQIEEEDQVECFMLSLFLGLACSVIFLGVLASFSQLSRTINMARQKQLASKKGVKVSEEKITLKTSLLTPLEPEPATGVVVARDMVQNSDGGRFVEVVYAPLRGD